MLNLYRAVFLFVVHVAIYWRGQQINYRIRLKLFKHDIFDHKLSLRKEKNSNDLKIFIYHYTKLFDRRW